MRPLVNEIYTDGDKVLCSCTETLKTRQEVEWHWRLGHFDLGYNPLDIVGDVKKFQEKFKVPINNKPTWVKEELIDFQLGLIEEEINELYEGIHKRDMIKTFDSLLDAVYTLIGFANTLGLGGKWNEGWKEVHRANMEKVMFGDSGKYITKPDHWKAPKLNKILGDLK